MISAPFAHVGGIPIEETLGSLGPALFVGFGVAWANLRSACARALARQSRPAARVRRARSAGGPV